MRRLSLLFAVAGVSLLPHAPASAWDYEGHRAINQLALASLPTKFPEFVREPAAAERIAFLAGEPDRWRNSPDLPLRHANGPDHYFDLEELALYGMKSDSLPVFRYDFVASLEVFREKNPGKIQPPSGKDDDHTAELLGLLPWSLAESYSKLKSGFSYLKAYEAHGGTPEEIANAKANIVYVMGVMGHWAGDAAQPLHTTIHHHGWVGPNPKGYSTNRSIHSWIDGGFFGKIGGCDLPGLKQKLRLADILKYQGRPAGPEEMFPACVGYLAEQHALVEKLYELDKAGQLSGAPGTSQEGRAFLEGQLLKAGQFLGDLWFSAWQQAPPDTFLMGQLAKRAKKSQE
jgi:hypothetical protein